MKKKKLRCSEKLNSKFWGRLEFRKYINRVELGKRIYKMKLGLVVASRHKSCWIVLKQNIFHDVEDFFLFSKPGKTKGGTMELEFFGV